MLIQGHNCTNTAAALNIAPATIYKWNAQPEFRLLQDSLRKQLSEQIIDKTSNTVSRLVQLFNEEAVEAFNTLKHIHSDIDVSPAVRRQAAVDILDRAPDAPKHTRESQVDIHSSVTIEAPLMENILKAAMEAGHSELFRAAGVDVLDVEFSDVDSENNSVDDSFGVCDIGGGVDLGNVAFPPQHSALTLEELLAQRTTEGDY
jgi:hypothetical protein